MSRGNIKLTARPKVTVQTKLNLGTVNVLREEAHRRGMSLSEVIRRLVEDAVRTSRVVLEPTDIN